MSPAQVGTMYASTRRQTIAQKASCLSSYGARNTYVVSTASLLTGILNTVPHSS